MNNLKRCETTDEGFLHGTDAQHGGDKLGQIIQTNATKPNQVKILLEEFAGDCVANWGRPGAEHSWRAYCRGMANLYVAKHAPLHQNLTKGAVTLAGMVMGGDLQCQVYAKIEDRRATSTNEQLSDLVSQYETRVEMVLNQLLPTCETLIFAGGGDRGIYAAAKSVVNSVDTCERVILLRIDPHMDERSVYCRSDPNKRDKFYPHSGNGVSHLKHDKLVAADFLLGVDNYRNNDQCHASANDGAKELVHTRHVTRDALRIEPMKHFDEFVAEINAFQLAHPACELVINIDVDSFNGIPSSAHCHVAGVSPCWAFYMCSLVNKFARKPRVVRIAELAYPDGDVNSQAVATEFAAECIKTLLDALANK